MGKAKRLKKERRRETHDLQGSISRLMTKNFQKEIRNSEIWDRMVAEFGQEKAEQLLKGCKAEVKRGGYE